MNITNNKISIILACLIFISGCTSRQIQNGQSQNIKGDISGTWEDPETGSWHEIIKTTEGYKVASVRSNSDNEYFEIRKSDWDGKRISWVYFVESTGYTVSFKMIKSCSTRMLIEWENKDAGGYTSSGNESLYKIINGERSSLAQDCEDSDYLDRSTEDEETDNITDPKDDENSDDAENIEDYDYSDSD